MLPVSGQATEINFDDLDSGSLVSNAYPEATFSSIAGRENVAFIYGSAHSPSNILCTRVPHSGITCVDDTYIDFTKPVNDLTFWAIEANAPGVTAQFNVFQSGVYAGTVDLVSTGGDGHNQFVDLSTFTNVTRLEIVNILDIPYFENNGIGWDTFRFTPVPEPSTALLLAAGLAVLAVRRRVA